jgi:hypothetical protein
LQRHKRCKQSPAHPFRRAYFLRGEIMKAFYLDHEVAEFDEMQGVL